MNKIITLCLLLSSFAFSQDVKHHNPQKEFESGKQYFLFGNDVLFRAEPNKKAEVISILEIGTQIEIIEKSKKTVNYKGIVSNYYKVWYNSRTGYILGALISLEKKTVATSNYFFSYAKTGNQFQLIIRHLNAESVITETSVSLGTEQFSLEVSNNKGIEGIENIVFINYIAEACGIDGGGIYLFQVNNTLKQVFIISEMTEAGIFSFKEQLIFPKDKNGIKGKIVYTSENKRTEDETTNWIETNTTRRELEWKNGAILPKLDLED